MPVACPILTDLNPARLQFRHIRTIWLWVSGTVSEVEFAYCAAGSAVSSITVARPSASSFTGNPRDINSRAV